MKPREGEKAPPTLDWTAMDILTAYGDFKGWVTAKAGRPDVHRAGNASQSFLNQRDVYANTQ